MMKPTDQLKKEHEAILRLLRVLEKICTRVEAGQEAEVAHLDQILEFLRVFADRCHHGKEERFLFPALEAAGMPKAGGPIGVMLQEHDAGRKYVQALSEASAAYAQGDLKAGDALVTAARAYATHLRQHIEKENTVLFPMADLMLSEAKQNSILDDFDRMEDEVIGQGKHEAFHCLLDRLSGIYLQGSCSDVDV